ncbi:MAG: hypothetical protein ABIS67_05770 [Candidatus Eisenbacteria bacterium]
MKPSHFVALAAVLALALGLWAAAGQFRPRGKPAESHSDAAPLADPSADMVTRAMQGVAAVPDSAEIKARWQNEVRGVELAGLDDAQREMFVRFANAGRCTCGCGYTLAGCKASDMSCEVSGNRLEALLDSIRTGKIRSAKGLRERPATKG